MNLKGQNTEDKQHRQNKPTTLFTAGVSFWAFPSSGSPEHFNASLLTKKRLLLPLSTELVLIIYPGIFVV